MRFTKRFMFMRFALPVCAFLALFPVMFILFAWWRNPGSSLADVWYELVAGVVIFFFCTTVHKWIAMYHKAVDLVNACQRLQDMPPDKVIYEPIGKILNVHAVSRCGRVSESATAHDLNIKADDLYRHLFILIHRELVNVKCWEEEGFHIFVFENIFLGVLSPRGEV